MILSDDSSPNINLSFRDCQKDCQGNAILVFSVCGLFTLNSCKYITEKSRKQLYAEENNTIRDNPFLSIKKPADERAPAQRNHH